MKYFLKILFIFLLYIKMCVSAEPSVVLHSPANAKRYRTMSQHELISIFSRKKLFWDDGSKITVFIKPLNSMEHKVFLLSSLSLTPYKFKVLLENIIYSGNNNPPIEVINDDDMLLKLTTTPNSIGYINYSIIVNDNQNELTTVKID